MYCPYCGKENADQARYCNACGKVLVLRKQPPRFDLSILFYLFGVLFVLLGIFPYLLQGDYTEYSRHLSAFSSRHSVHEFLAVSYFRSFTFLSSMFYFSSSMLTVYIGVLMLRKTSNLTTPIVISAITHVVSILCGVITNFMTCYFPQTVLSFYTNDKEVISAGIDIAKSDLDYLYYYQDTALCRLAVSFTVIALAVAFIYVNKRYIVRTVQGAVKVNTVGSALMILSVIPLEYNSVTHFILSEFCGFDVAAAKSVVKSVFTTTINSWFVAFYVIVLVIAVLFGQKKKKRISLITIGILLLFGFIATLFSGSLIAEMGTPSDLIFYFAVIMLKGAMVAAVGFLIAMYYWFRAVSRNQVPLWLQILWPLLLPVVYIGIEVLTLGFLVLSPAYSYGIMGVILITIVLSVLLQFRKQRC